MKKIGLWVLCGILVSCDAGDITQEARIKRNNEKAEYVVRLSDQVTVVPPMEPVAAPLYSWDRVKKGQLDPITKEYFRCKGSSTNPSKAETVRGEPVRYFDCGGREKHSLFLSGGEEFVYPILLKLLNHVQEKTQKRVVITSGYRCPDHNTYVDPSPSNQTSKHMIAAEVDFYVQGMEQKPQEIVNLLIAYYKGQKGFEEFVRYEKPDASVSTPPWMNKEVFIKLQKSNEGRNFDNRHPYPYITIQVRFDREKNSRVTYSWDQAFRGYLRY
jgi:hypothetical protein